MFEFAAVRIGAWTVSLRFPRLACIVTSRLKGLMVRIRLGVARGARSACGSVLFSLDEYGGTT